MLHQVSYQELKSLALQYPYAANLRYLLLIKSYLDNNGEQEKNLAMASLNSTDRRKLKQLVAHFQPIESLEESFSLEEDFLELKDLNVLEEIPSEPEIPLAEMSVEPPVDLEDSLIETGDTKSDTPIFEGSEELEFLDAFLDNEPEEDETSGEMVSDEEEAVLDEAIEAVMPDTELEDIPTASIDELIENGTLEVTDFDEMDDEVIEEEFSIQELMEGMSEQAEKEEAAEKAIDETLEELFEADAPTLESNEDDAPDEASAPEAADLEDLDATPPPAPASWLDRVKKPQKGIVLDNLSELPPVPKKAKKKKNKPKKRGNVKKVASKSILEDTDIATETLAGLLERQGYYDKAIGMYEKLKSKYPERGAFFGDKIEALKKLKK